MGEAFLVRRGSQPEEFKTITLTNTMLFATVSEGKPTLPTAASAHSMASVSTPKYAIFAGGVRNITTTTSSVRNAISAFNRTLVRTPNLTLVTARSNLGGAAVDSAVIFAGGLTASGSGRAVDKVEAYDSVLLTRLSSPSTLSEKKYDLGAATVASHAIFAGGIAYTNNSTLYTVDAFGPTLVKTKVSPFNADRAAMGSASSAKYAVFAGGHSPKVNLYYQNVTAYDAQLSAYSAAGLSVKRCFVAGATLAHQYILFIGGQKIGLNDSAIDVYDASTLAKVTTIKLPQNLSNMCATSFGDYVVAAGGEFYDGTAYYRAYIIDTSLTIVKSIQFATQRTCAAAATIGDYALIAGGKNGNKTYNTIDVLKIIDSLTIFPGMTYKLGSMESEVTATELTAYPTTSPVSGYIKVPDINK